MKSYSLILKLTILLSSILYLQSSLALCPSINLLIIKDSAQPLQIYRNHKPSGIIYDFLKESIPEDCKLGVEVYPFKRMIKLMEEKKVSNWLNYGALAWKNIQVQRPSKYPLFFANNVVLTMHPNKVSKISDLFGKTVILISGFKYPGLEEYIDKGKIKAFYVKDYNNAVNALRKNRGFGFVGMDFRMSYTIKNSFLNKSDFIHNDFSKIIAGYNIYLTYSEDFPSKMKKVIDRKIYEFTKNGKMLKIVRKYTN